MNYFNPLPIPELITPKTDVPAFVKNKYKVYNFSVEYMLKLVRWAEMEFSDTLAYYATNKEVYNRLKSLNPSYIVASTDVFKNLVNFIDEVTWATYPKALRVFIINTAKLLK